MGQQRVPQERVLTEVREVGFVGFRSTMFHLENRTQVSVSSNTNRCVRTSHGTPGLPWLVEKTRTA